MTIKNDFNNPAMEHQPPWTICRASYQGVEFQKIEWGAISQARTVKPGIDYLLMVMAWEDPECAPEHSLPMASRHEEEAVAGQQRTIYINAPNHQGPCPPEGIPPIPEEQYQRILSLWPEYDFLPYHLRNDNPQCAN